MKLSIIALFFLGITNITAERVIRFNFPGDPLACNATDMEKVDLIFQANGRRHLRTLVTVHDLQRELSTTTATCQEACKFQPPGRCITSACPPRRRDLFQRSTVNRELTANLTCNENINVINSKLNRLIATQAVSPSCMLLLAGPNREFVCFDNVIYGNIDNVRLWNLNTSTTNPLLMTNTMTSGRVSLCKSTLFNIEGAANTCVEKMHFDLVGPNYQYNRTEDKKPFSLYGNTQNILNGVRLSSIGNYTLTITADQIVTNAKTIHFRVKDC